MYFENFKCFNFLTINHLSFQSYSKYHMCLLTWSHWNNRRQLTSKTSFWWRLRYRKLQTLSALVTHSESNFHFYALWKRQITRGFTGYGSRAFHRLQKWNEKMLFLLSTMNILQVGWVYPVNNYHQYEYQERLKNININRK